MKKLNRIITIVLVAVGFAVAPANAQFRFGVKAGVNVNSLHFNTNDFNTSNRAGFTGGVMAEFTVPLLGIGGDVSALYTHRSVKSVKGIDDPDDNEQPFSFNSDYIDIPINFKWKINIPVVNNIIRPFLTTGPSFAFLINKSKVPEGYKNKDIAWNFGFGVELVKHLQLGASYGLGLSKVAKGADLTDIYGKSRVWTVTAAYLF